MPGFIRAYLDQHFRIRPAADPEVAMPEVVPQRRPGGVAVNTDELRAGGHDEPQPVSFPSRVLLPALLRATRAQRLFGSRRVARRHLAAQALRPRAFGPPRLFMRRDVVVSVDRFNGWPVYTIQPAYTVKPAADPSSGAVVYLHGGAWVREIAPEHWRLCAQIAAEAQVAVIVPIYPLVPFGTAAEVMPIITQLVLQTRRTYGKTCLAGDSAGGQMALSSAIDLRDKHGVSLAGTTLISPGLDLSLNNPDIDGVQPHDPWLARDGTRVYVDHWRGELPIDHPLVSPLFADMAGLGPVTVFCGTRDIVLPDTRLLVGKLTEAGVTVTYHEEAGLLHVYPLTPTREGRMARSRIVAEVAAAVGGE